VDIGDYPGVPKEHIIVLKMSQRDFTEEDKDWGKGIVYEELRETRGYGEPWEYHARVDGYHCWYTYWATDIFPSQMDENIRKLESGELESKRTREIHFVGHMEEIWAYFRMLCNGNGIPFHHHGASFSRDSMRNKSTEENMELIQCSWFAPAFQSDHQVKHRYIPCRLFKNISYGKMGMTNNPVMVELFGKYLEEGERGLLFSREVIELVNQGIEYENMAYSEDGKKWLRRLMEIVRDHHTFLNRLETLRNFIGDYTPDFALVWG
jgi:hypothetical protein